MLHYVLCDGVFCVLFSFKKIYDKTIINSVFVISGIIKVFGNVSFGVTVTLTLIIQDIPKTTPRGIVNITPDIYRSSGLYFCCGSMISALMVTHPNLVWSCAGLSLIVSSHCFLRKRTLLNIVPLHIWIQQHTFCTAGDNPSIVILIN